MLDENGVRTAAWATLSWTVLLAGERTPAIANTMLADLEPSKPRKAWLDFWLRNNLSQRTTNAHWIRLLAFSPFLHDSARDVMRAARGRRQTSRRRQADLDVFAELLGE